MRWTQTLLPTWKEAPAGMGDKPEQWLIRAGLLAPVSGAYAWLPVGMRILQKLQDQIRKLLTEAGGQEIGLPLLTPVSLWERTAAGELREPIGLRLDLAQQERKGRYLLGSGQTPVLAEVLAGWLTSYRNLPLLVFQTTAVCSSEGTSSEGLAEALLRPAVQAYGFYSSAESAHRSYQRLLGQCEEWLNSLELPYWVAQTEGFEEHSSHRVVVRSVGGGWPPTSAAKDQSNLADAGTLPPVSLRAPNSRFSHLGERKGHRRPSFLEEVAFCEQCGYTAVRESARIGGRPMHPVAGEAVLAGGTGQRHPENSEAVREEVRRVSTPGARTIAEVTAFLDRPAHQFLKTLLYLADGHPVAILIRGDHEASETKIRRAFGIRQLEMADPATVQRVTGAPVGFSGPVGLQEPIPLWADWDVASAENVVVGANQADAHLVGVCIGRDFRPDFFADLRMAMDGDMCPQCSAVLQVDVGLPVAESACLGQQQSQSLGLRFHDAQEAVRPVLVSRLQIDLARLLAAMAAVHHDPFGLVWPEQAAPFDILFLCLSIENKALMEAALQLYEVWQAAGLEVLLDDRELRPGVKFYDADLLGIPWRVVLGPRNFQEGFLEIKHRRTGQKYSIPLAEAAQTMIEKVQAAKNPPPQ